jgi:hypothetical protein
MKRELRKFVRDLPSSAGGIPETSLWQLKDVTLTKTTTLDEFLKQVHQLSLVVTLFKKQDRGNLRNVYRKLLSHLPVSTLEKFGADKDETLLGRAEALTGLVSHHSGEIVEVDATRSFLSLKPLVLGDPSKSCQGDWGERWFCVPEGDWGEQWFCTQRSGLPRGWDMATSIWTSLC